MEIGSPSRVPTSHLANNHGIALLMNTRHEWNRQRVARP
jgi:hypothetical protein